MKTKSIISTFCALLGLAVLADSYTFTAGEVIPLKTDGNQAGYVSTSGNIKVSSEKHVDSTKANDVLTINLNNSTSGDYVLSTLGTADGYAANYTLSVTDGASYSKSITVVQKNTKEGTTLANPNLGASNSKDCNAQWAYLVLNGLPAGELTMTLRINSTSATWAGNYGYFTISSLGSVSSALDLASNNGTILSGLSSADYLEKCGTVSCEGNGVAFGSTKSGAVVSFSLYSESKATCAFSYDAGSKNSAGTSIKWVLLSSDGSTVSQTSTDSIAQTADWWGEGNVNNYSHDFGLLPAGFYTLTGYVVNSADVWAGNFGNFTFTYTASADLDITSDYALTESISDRQVNISGSPVIDLAGYSMTLVQATTALSGTAVITNSSATLSTLTLKNLTDSTLLKGLQFSGNVKLVIDGWSSNVEFNSNATVAYDSASANSHTGGTTLQNSDNTKTLTIYNQSALGSGTITFNGNAYLKYPDNGNPQSAPTFSNNICVNNAGNKWEGAFGGQSSQVNFNGDWSGEGELWMFNSWQPEIYINNISGHGNESFTGTLLLTDNRDFDRGYHIGEYSIGFPNATVCLTNRYVSGDYRRMELYLQTRSGVAKFGRLITDQVKTNDGYTQHTNTAVIANHTTSTAIHIGATGASADYDIFSGYFKEQKMDDSDSAKRMALSLVKEGAGTLELNGQTASSFTDGITVSGGALILNTTVSTASAVTVAEGAQFYGTVPTGGSVTYASGAIIDCDTAHTITGNVDLSRVTVAGSNPSEGVFLTINGIVSGTKPQLSDELKSARKLGSRNGKWFIDVASENGVTTYSLVWKPTAFVVVIR